MQEIGTKTKNLQKKSVMKRILLILIAMFAVMSVSAQNKRTIVAYFSATGKTEAVAKQLAKEHHAELFEIEPKNAYTEEDLDYHNSQSRSSKEMNDSQSHPTLKQKKELAMYDTIYIGFPIWWNQAPRIINTFIEQAKLKGKSVIPFATSGSSSIENSVKELAKDYPTIKWQKGLLLNKKK